MIVGSPGGISSTTGHWTKGFYGDGAASADFFAGQGVRYPYGVYRGLYTVGDNAPHHLGYYTKPPDTVYDVYSQGGASYETVDETPYPEVWGVPPPQKKSVMREARLGTGVQRLGSAGLEGFEVGPSAGEFARRREIEEQQRGQEMYGGREDYTHVFDLPLERPGGPPPQETAVGETPLDEFQDHAIPQRPFLAVHSVKVSLNPYILFAVFIVAYIALSLWSTAGLEFIKDRFHGGQPMGWRWLLVYAVAFTIVMVGLGLVFKIPIVSFETL